jgi:hypothetical protein
MMTMMPLLDEYLDADVLKPYKDKMQMHYLQQQERADSLSFQRLKSMMSTDSRSTESNRIGYWLGMGETQDEIRA